MGPKPRKFCLNGYHPLSGGNVIYGTPRNGKPKRQCRTCTLANQRARRLVDLDNQKAKNRESYYRNRKKVLARLKAKYWAKPLTLAR